MNLQEAQVWHQSLGLLICPKATEAKNMINILLQPPTQKRKKKKFVGKKGFVHRVKQYKFNHTDGVSSITHLEKVTCSMTEPPKDIPGQYTAKVVYLESI